MKILKIINEERIPKTNAQEIEEQLAKEGKRWFEIEGELFDIKKLEEPKYILEVTNKEYQLISFYLELERRKPITNIQLDTKKGGRK